MVEQLSEIEEQRSFDIQAALYAYQHDLSTVGYIRNETKQRVYDEELTYVAEGINRPLHTPFTLPRVNGELAIFYKGSWQPYIATLERGRRVAEREARVDHRRAFLVNWAERDLAIGKKCNELLPGQKLAWCSPFPEDEYQKYGQQFIDSQGFQSARRMGFIYLAEKNHDGSLTLHTRSVDNSDLEAFAAAMDEANKPEAHSEDAILAYDRILTKKHGGRYYAGRRQEAVIPEENAWAIIERHHDLVDFYFLKLEALAKQPMPHADTERAKQRLTYSLWASLKERMDQHAILPAVQRRSDAPMDYYQLARLETEFDRSYQKLSKLGEVLFGCGGIIRGEEALLQASSEQVFDAIFGTKSEWKKMTCPFCGDKDQWGDPCSSNQHCKACNARVIGGKVKNRGNGGKKRKTRLYTLFDTAGISNN